ncbi:MAG TPA: hypothetical protein VD772_05445 [Anseongella sp.]|nr:hypothetical protein [Anseongella sp.]
MAVYRFRVAFEDYDGYRDIDIRSNQTFEDLHYAIHQSIGYKADYPSSFYVSNDQWHKGEEITLFPDEKKAAAGVRLMKETKLSKFIEDPHQKFYYIFNFERPLDFQVELIRIEIDTQPGVSYPVCVKSVGEAPKQFLAAAAVPPITEEFEGDDLGLDDETRMELEEFAVDGEEHETEADEHNDEFEGSEGDDLDFEDGDEEEFKKGEDDF